MEFGCLDEFGNEFNKLKKKYRTLDEDLELLKVVLAYRENGNGKFIYWHPPGIVRVSGLGIQTEIYKVKHFTCKALKGKGSRSGIRIIFAYLSDKVKIEFVQIYYKDRDDEDCDKERIKAYYS